MPASGSRRCWCGLVLVGGLPDLLLPWAGFPLIALLLPLVLIHLDHLWLPEPLCRWACLSAPLLAFLFSPAI